MDEVIGPRSCGTNKDVDVQDMMDKSFGSEFNSMSEGEDHGRQPPDLAILDARQPTLTKRRRPNTSDECNNTDNAEIDEEDNVGFTVVHRKSKSRSHTIRVQNNGIETFEVSLTSYEILPKQIGLAKLLKAENIENIIQIKYKSPYKVIIIFDKKEDAEKLITNKKFIESNVRCHLTSEVGISYGIVRYLELDVAEEELKKSLQCEFKIESIKRLKRLSDSNEWINSETVRFGFRSSKLPDYIYGYGCRFRVEPYTFPVTQCSNCWKFGHLARVCPLKHQICPKCGERHTNCEEKNYFCVNCKGNHMSFHKTCPKYLKEKEIRAIMAKHNYTYKNALFDYNERKKDLVSHKNVNQAGNNDLSQRSPIKKTFSEILGTKSTKIQGKTREEINTVMEWSNNGQISTSDSERNEKKMQTTKRRAKKKEKETEELERFGTEEHVRRETIRAEIHSGEKSDRKTFKEKLSFRIFILKLKDLFLSEKSCEEIIEQLSRIVLDAVMSFFNKEMFGRIWDLVVNNYG